MLTAPPAEARPARIYAAVGAGGELLASRLTECRMGVIREVYEHGTVARRGRVSEVLTAAGLAGALVAGRRSRVGAAASGLALLTGSALQRFGRLPGRCRVHQGPPVRGDPAARAAGRRRP
jgi:hypothetical protein